MAELKRTVVVATVLVDLICKQSENTQAMKAMEKDNTTVRIDVDPAMKSHMKTEQASMKSQMALQLAVIDHLQTMSRV